MKWYTTVLNRIFKGIILFLLPLMVLFFIFEKAIAIIHRLIIPIKSYLPAERIMGIGLLSLLSVLLLSFICYFAGILAEMKKIKTLIAFLENNLLTMIPGYVMMKSRASEAIGSADEEWKTVAVGDGDEWKIGIEVDQQPGGYSMVFFPEPPDAKSGEMKLIHASKLKNLDIPVGKLVNIIRKYGHGASSLVSE